LRGGALPPALLFAALGLALAFATPRARAYSLMLLCVTLTALSFATFPPDWLETAFLGCWVSVVVTAAVVHLPRGPGMSGALVLSVNAGVWASGVIALSGTRLDLVEAVPCALLVLPAAWLVARRASIAVKVASSWLIAIAMLAAVLPFLPVTPGYMPDHLE
jgi:hypothetical protein